MELTRKLIRGPKLAVLVPGPSIMESLCGKGGVPFEEGLALAEGRVLASSARISRAMAGGEWTAVIHALPCWCGTISAYTERGKRFGSTLEHDAGGLRWVLQVPEAFRAERDAVLVAEHPDYAIERDGRNRIIHAAALALRRRFPPASGWFPCDPEHGIPCGHPLPPQDPAAGYLSRIPSFVGPIARLPLFYFGAEKRRDICIEMKPCRSLGVVVEAQGDGMLPEPPKRIG